jgi:curved DNA-binding protein CbpA/TPR repeat protein
MKSYYELLGASADDDAEALKDAFRKTVKAHHPDLHPSDPGAVERFSEIIAANALLRDAKRRATYDWLLRLEREGGFQLKLKQHQLRSKPLGEQRPLMRTIAVIAAVSALIGGYALWATMPTSGNGEIHKGEPAAAAAAALEKQTATVVAAAGENENRRAARSEIVADHRGAETVGNSLSEGRNDGAAVSTAATDIAPASANRGLASIDLPLGPAGSAMKPQSVRTPVAPAVTHRPASLSTLTTPSRPQNLLDTLPARAASRQLTIDAVRLRPTDALLAISAEDVGSDAAVVVGGLAPGSTLSAGARAGPNIWRLSTKDLGDVVLAPPRGFVGGMDLSFELRLADQAVVDRKAIQLEWSTKDALAPPKSQRLGAVEIALIMEKGAALIGIGNVAGARLMFQYAAEAGDPVAAFALAESFDPLVLGTLNARGGITANVGLAQTWYQKAKDLGSAAAPERLERLARLRK